MSELKKTSPSPRGKGIEGKGASQTGAPLSQETGQRLYPVANARAKRLRKDMPATERKFWESVRALEGLSGKFRRQAPIGPYVVDFVHHGAKLAIELDGPHHDHEEAQARDAKKDDWLKRQGFHVMRIPNAKIWNEADDVLNAIRDAVNGADPSPLTPLPQGERGDNGPADG